MRFHGYRFFCVGGPGDLVRSPRPPDTPPYPPDGHTLKSISIHLTFSRSSLEKERRGWRATGGEGEGPAARSAPTRRPRIPGGVDEEAQGRVKELWRAGVLAPPLSPDKGGKGKIANHAIASEHPTLQTNPLLPCSIPQPLLPSFGFPGS